MRHLHGLNELAHAFTEAAIMHEEALVAAAGATSVVLQDNVKEVYGDRKVLKSLAKATQEERVKHGYSPNEPLLRDGSLLRDTVERMHAGTLAGVGSPEPVSAYHEFGYVNARTGKSVPPRPAFRIGAAASIPEVEAIVKRALAATFRGGGSVELKP